MYVSLPTLATAFVLYLLTKSTIGVVLQLCGIVACIVFVSMHKNQRADGRTITKTSLRIGEQSSEAVGTVTGAAVGVYVSGGAGGGIGAQVGRAIGSGAGGGKFCVILYVRNRD